MYRVFAIIGILFYCYNGCVGFTSVHNRQKRQSQIEYQATIDTGSLRNLATGLQDLLNTVQKATNMGQQFQYGAQFNMNKQNDQGTGQNYHGGPPGGFGPPNGPPGGPGFGPPPGGPPGRHGRPPPGRRGHFGPPGRGRHPPPPPPSSHEGYGPPGPPDWQGYGHPRHYGPPGPPSYPPDFGRPPLPPPSFEGPPGGFGPPGWPGYGPPGPPHWQGYGPPGHHGPPGPPPDFGRPPPPPPPFEGGNFPSQPPNQFPPNSNNNQQNGNIEQASTRNPGIVLGQNEDKDKSNIVGYLDGNFPIILLGDNEIRR